MEKQKPKPAKRKTDRPKVRGTWAINPKTRVEESEKLYDRSKQKADDRRAIDGIIDFFGE